VNGSRNIVKHATRRAARGEKTVTIDVTIQSNGYDVRDRGGRVTLLPDVVEVRFNTKAGKIDVARGTRDRLATALRKAGYDVRWHDENPAVVLGAMTSPAKAAASRRNGRLSKGPKPLKPTTGR
jgi:hypothetical protein